MNVRIDLRAHPGSNPYHPGRSNNVAIAAPPPELPQEVSEDPQGREPCVRGYDGVSRWTLWGERILSGLFSCPKKRSASVGNLFWLPFRHRRREGFGDMRMQYSGCPQSYKEDSISPKFSKYVMRGIYRSDGSTICRLQKLELEL